MPEPAELAGAFGIIFSRTGSGRNRRALRSSRSRSSSPPPRAGPIDRGAIPIDAGGPCALVASAPGPTPRRGTPGHRRGCTDHRTDGQDSADRPLVQLRLHREYPRLGLIEVGPRRAGVHQRPPRSALMLRTRWTPSPCDRLSRPRTTTGPPPHPDGISRRRAFPPTSRPPAVGDRRDGSHVHSRTVRRVRRPAMPLQHRHGYAAGLHRGLPAGDINRPRSSPPPCGGCALLPSPDPPGSSWWFLLRGVQPLVPHVHLPVLLAGPGPSGGAGPSRRCQGCFHPHPRLPDQAAPSFTEPAATSRRRCPFITARFKSASWRSMSSCQRHRRRGVQQSHRVLRDPARSPQRRTDFLLPDSRSSPPDR